MRYTWTVNDPSGFITGEAPSVGNGYPLSRNIIQQLSNSDTDAHEVIYTLTPHSIRGDSTLRCAGAPIDVTIWVEPTLLITAEADTLCNEDFTNIDPQSINTTTRGMRYTWTVNDPSGFITGEAPSVGNGYPLSRNIIQQLSNSDTDAHEVIYTITPHSIRGDSTLRCAGTPIDVTIWVEPTLAITAEADTLCNEDFTNIDPQSVNTTTRGMRYTWTVNDPSGFITGEAPSVGNGYPLSRNIIQQLSNSDTDAHEVIYTLTPHSIRGDSTLRCAGTPINVTIWVEPTPTVDLLRENDSIFCTGLSTSVRISSPTQPTFGVRFRYTIHALSPGDLDYTLLDTFDLQKGERIEDIINNLSNSVQSLYVVVIPYLIDPFGTPKCEGIKDSIYYEVTPELIMQDYAQTYTLDTINLRCFEDNSGIIFLDAIGGITAYHADSTISSLNYYFEENLLADSTRGIYQLSAGLYTLRSTDWSGCIAYDTLVLYQPDELVSEFVVLDSAFCEGETGRYQINPSGGTTVTDGGTTYGYDVEWINPGAGYPHPPPYPNPLPDAAFGLFRWEVLDTNNCSTGNALVMQPEQIYIQQFNPVHVNDTFDYGVYPISCIGQSDGRIEAFVEPRNNYFTFFLINSSIDTVETAYGRGNQYFNDLPADQYSLHVYSQNGCFNDEDTVLIEPELLEITDTSILKYHELYETSCFYSKDGKITVESVAGGRGAYNYIWTDSTGSRIGTNSSILDSIPGGEYHVMVNDNYCMDSADFSLNSPPEIVLQDNVTNLPCNNLPTGVIVIQPNGGLGAHSIDWEDDGLSGFSVSGLSADTYLYTVEDAVGCFITDSSEVTEPSAIAAESETSDYNGFEVACDDGNNGWISVISSGGSGDHRYSWDYEGSSIGQDSSSIVNLIEGTYNLIITDTNNCEYNASFDMDAPTKIRIAIENTSQVCSNPGTISSTVTGGFGDYQLVWSNGSTGTHVDQLEEGIYYVTITDVNNCSVIDSTEIIKESSMEIDIVVIDSVRCFGTTDGVLGIDTLFATPPMEVYWNGGLISQQELENVGEGRYTVYATDANDCFAYDTLDVTSPLDIEVETFTTNASCYDSASGAATFWATGGNGGFIYAWDGELIEGSAVDFQYAGTHALKVYDWKNCEKDAEVIIGQPDQILVYALEEDLVYPDCEYAENGSIIVTVEGGTGNYTYYWPDIEGNNTSRAVDNLKSDSYQLIVSDNNNCTVDTTFNLESQYESCLDIPSAFTPNGDDFNEQWIILNFADPEVPVSERYPNMVIEVFDRIGRKVWVSEEGYTRDVNSGWDGRDKQTGKLLPVDSYYYFVHLNNESGKILQGIVTIIR